MGDHTCSVVLTYINGWCFLGQINNSNTGREKVVVRASHPNGCSGEKKKRSGSRRCGEDG